MRAFHVSVTVVCAAALLATSHFTVRPVAQQPDTTAALLVEVRGLRAALEQLASAGPRVQLMFGRLQLQEQRIVYMPGNEVDAPHAGFACSHGFG